MQTTREKNAAWLPSESPRLAFGEPPPFGKGGYGVGWRTAWDSLWHRLAFWPTRPENSGFGLQRKRSTAKRLPARDGSERRQIPLPFFGAGKGSSWLYKQRVS